VQAQVRVQGQWVRVSVRRRRGWLLGRVALAEMSSVAAGVVAVGTDLQEMLAALAEALTFGELDCASRPGPSPADRGSDRPA
jgi:hypothetical protein